MAEEITEEDLKTLLNSGATVNKKIKDIKLPKKDPVIELANAITKSIEAVYSKQSSETLDVIKQSNVIALAVKKALEDAIKTMNKPERKTPSYHFVVERDNEGLLTGVKARAMK